MSLPSGYGLFSVPRPYARQMYAHRLAMERKLHRRLETREYVLHSCDNPPCVNPNHLRIGNQADNMADAKTRGRTARGAAVVTRGTKLSEQDVREIAALLRTPGTLHQTIADRYGVARATITQINLGRSWGWLTGFTKETAATRASERVTLTHVAR